MRSEPKPLSWKPRARGLIFCSPACGFDCTREAYEAAKKAGDALAKQLGKGWKARVWENLGWHYAAVSACGRWKVHPMLNRQASTITGYHAYLGQNVSGGRWVAFGRTPESAIRNTRKKARAEVAEHTSMLDMALNA